MAPDKEASTYLNGVTNISEVSHSEKRKAWTKIIVTFMDLKVDFKIYLVSKPNSKHA